MEIIFFYNDVHQELLKNEIADHKNIFHLFYNSEE